MLIIVCCFHYICLGIFGVVWFVLWMVVVADSPGQHPRITEVEKNYIQDSIGGKNTEKNRRVCIRSGPFDIWGVGDAGYGLNFFNFQLKRPVFST